MRNSIHPIRFKAKLQQRAVKGRGAAWVFLVLCLTARQAAAACLAGGPVETARWIYTNQRTFTVYQTPQDSRLMARFLSPALLGLLKVEWQCQVIEEGLCALDTDPWTNKEDDEALAPVGFESAGTGASGAATVQMRFRFARAGHRSGAAPESGKATFRLVKDKASGCWLLDDIVGSGGVSLAATLRGYRFYP